MAKLRLERQCIIWLLKECDDNNKFTVKGKERKDYIEYKKYWNKNWQLIKRKEKYDYLIQSSNQLITSKKKYQNFSFI